MKKTILAVFLLAAIGIAIPSTAEIYKYIDENGQKRWTDDLSQVPKGQRPTAQRLAPENDKGSSAGGVAAKKQETQPGPDTTRAIEPDAVDAPQSNQGPPLSRDALIAEKAELDKQYERLMQERKKLAEINIETVSTSEREELEKRVAAYNQQVDTYGIRLQNFNSKVDQYNKQHSAVQAKVTE